MFWIKSKKSSIKKFRIATPVPISGRHGLAIAVCLRNEGRYIGEWVRFHRAVGVRHFIAYDNGSTDDTVEVLMALLEPDALTIVPWAGQVSSRSDDRFIDGQALAFAHAIMNFGSLFRRMAFIDADEFLLPKVGTTIEDALSATDDFPNISLPWHMFGSNGHRQKPAGPVVLNYTKRSADPLSRKQHSTNFKCIVDPCEIVEVSVHQFKTREHGDVTVNDAGQRFSRRGRKGTSFYSSKFLQLNHYYSKSEEEMREKILRGSKYAKSSQELIEKMQITMENIEHDEVEDHGMVDFVRKNSIEL
jgi:hypothetical protein